MHATPIAESHRQELAAGERFAFGENWARFLSLLTEQRIAGAEESLRRMLRVDSLQGRTFLDIGSGSGLFSLAARRLGATVHSFDYDTDSVACTAELRRRFFPDDMSWRVEQASVLDEAYLSRLGKFDVVYSWGVLHHTGSMWKAIQNAAGLVAPGGLFFIALYNDQGVASRMWRRVKRAYCGAPKLLKPALLALCFVRLWGPTTIKDVLRGRPGATWRNYGKQGATRGMDPWRDVVDWVGGYPFEVATPGEVDRFARDRGFIPEQVNTCGTGKGCNEFVFRLGA